MVFYKLKRNARRKTARYGVRPYEKYAICKKTAPKNGSCNFDDKIIISWSFSIGVSQRFISCVTLISWDIVGGVIAYRLIFFVLSHRMLHQISTKLTPRLTPVLLDKLEFIYLLYLFCLYLYLAKLYPSIEKSNPSIGAMHPFHYHQ